MTDLPDVNVLVALLWESHLHHATARRWFASSTGFATCAITQAGFVRVSSNPRVLADAIGVAHATAVLAALVARHDHTFLRDDHGYVGNPHLPHDRVVGHRQVTDAQILAVARQHGAQVVTLDAGLAALGGPDARHLAG